MRLVRQACSITDIQAWMADNDIPLCMFMPDRHAMGYNSRNNETQFRLVTRYLTENQTVSKDEISKLTFKNSRNFGLFK